MSNTNQKSSHEAPLTVGEATAIVLQTEPAHTPVHRVLAPNAGMMTGPGTNTYLVGTQDIAVIDPGPDLPDHTQAILNAAQQLGGQIRWILCTHTHADHSPGATALKAATGAEIWGNLPDKQLPGHDASFKPDHIWQQDKQPLPTDAFTLQTVHTPGHASNHWCYYLASAQLLFTGDHIMEGSTVVITPPDGDMGAYLASLEKLLTLSLRGLAPGHGQIIHTPHDIIRHTIAHRLKREAKALTCLQASQPITLDDLVGRVYDDVPAFLHPIARYSLEAHLIKLAADGKAQCQAASWRAL